MKLYKSVFLLLVSVLLFSACAEDQPDIILPDEITVGKIDVDFPESLTVDKITNKVRVIVETTADMSYTISWRISSASRSAGPDMWVWTFTGVMTNNTNKTIVRKDIKDIHSVINGSRIANDRTVLPEKILAGQSMGYWFTTVPVHMPIGMMDLTYSVDIKAAPPAQ